MAVYVFLLVAVVSLLQGSAGLTSSVKNAFVNRFNAVRRDEAVSENVSNMWKMLWGDFLATRSQNWANNCKFEHSQLTAGTSEVIYVTSSQTETFEKYAVQAINSWVSEKKFNADKSFSCCGQSGSNTCGHYCQSVKDVNTRVGCGIKKCSPVKGFQGFPKGTLVVCQFRSQGNGAPKVYKHGAPCSACGAKTHCKNHLCVNGIRTAGR